MKVGWTVRGCSGGTGWLATRTSQADRRSTSPCFRTVFLPSFSLTALATLLLPLPLLPWAEAIQDFPVQSAICEPKPNAEVIVECDAGESEGSLTVRGYALAGGKLRPKDMCRVTAVQWCRSTRLCH